MTVLASALACPYASGSALSNETRISQFIGAWGILFMAVGGIVIVTALVRMAGERRRRRSADKS